MNTNTHQPTSPPGPAVPPLSWFAGMVRRVRQLAWFPGDWDGHGDWWPESALKGEPDPLATAGAKIH